MPRHANFVSALYILLSIHHTEAWTTSGRSVLVISRRKGTMTHTANSFTYNQQLYTSNPKQQSSESVTPLITIVCEETASRDILLDSSPQKDKYDFPRNLFLGIQPTPDIIAIMAIYFVEGALGLSRLAQTFYLKDNLHLGPAESSALAGLFAVPWMIKPLYGFLSDGFPLFGSRRRNYLILCGLLCATSYVALGCNFWNWLDNPSLLHNDSISLLQASIGAFIISSACIAFSDVVADGIVVERTRDSSDPSLAGNLQSLCWGSAAFGGIITAYFSGSLLELMGPTQIFLLTSALPMIVAFIAFFVDDRKKQDPRDKGSNSLEYMNLYKQIQILWSAVKEPAVWKPTLFLFLWQSTPTSEGAFFYFMNNELNLGPEFFGRVRLIVSVASLVGVWLYQNVLRSVSVHHPFTL